jgi:hypothetical protein
MHLSSTAGLPLQSGSVQAFLYLAGNLLDIRHAIDSL